MKPEIQFFHSTHHGSTSREGFQSRHIFSNGAWYQPDRMGFGLLKSFCIHQLAPCIGLDLMPVDNLEFIFIPLNGNLGYRDGLGNHFKAGLGEMILLSSGTGLFYTLYNPNLNQEVRFLQIGVLPRKRNLAPQCRKFRFGGDKQAIESDGLTSDGNDDAGQIRQRFSLQRCEFVRGSFAEISRPEENSGIFLFMLSGEISIFGKTLIIGDAIGIQNSMSNRMEVLQDASFLLLQVPMVQDLMNIHGGGRKIRTKMGAR